MDQLLAKISEKKRILDNIRSEKTPLFELQRDSFKRFQEVSFPTKKIENWKYTPLDKILQHNYKLHSIKDTQKRIDVSKLGIDFSENYYHIVIINGKLQSSLNRIPKNISLNTEADIPKTKKRCELLSKNMSSEGFFLLNTALFEEVIHLTIPSDTQVEKPIYIHFLHTQETETLYNPRVFVNVEKNSQATAIERHYNKTSHHVLTNYQCEISLDRNAKWNHYKIQSDTDTSYLIDQTYATQQRDSVSKFVTLSYGNAFVRNDLNTDLLEENAICNLFGISYLKGKQFADHHTEIRHIAPRCESNELYKGIFDEESKGVFNGKVWVEKDAQKTSGFQQNNNILLNPKSKIYTKPQLEIFADDVRCSHGCTVGQIDEKSLFYLKSRGISSASAKKILLLTFVEEVISQIEIPEITQQLKQALDLEVA